MLTLLGILASAAAPLPADVIGRWQTETRHGIVEIATCPNAGAPSICGRLIDSDALKVNPQKRDDKNKDAALRERRLMGLTLLQGFTARNSEWTGGTIYNADDGGTYQATVTLIDRDTIKVKGCIVWPLCKSQTWKRVN